ncbi:unnamed protein product [Hymenolepis diminuta]|uniref:Uncharacterized protein n=1 Tax=Hymenolepis diminuta TaxID=6216 RepID=A0A564YG23_HYMDI|nr:unnamed protein product [Hymenolepis diminuta]
MDPTVRTNAGRLVSLTNFELVSDLILSKRIYSDVPFSLLTSDLLVMLRLVSDFCPS